ncbi:type II toxin-antitoxin system RelE/ParE family toxin [uncultured Campylobacter sp.]|jgi:plasmid stabilization system|uniref:type II toxin-antitoxin system RelE/ParE family toxin n=1 Tax=uncultured Campylobacter sp. TaxID=218934 RepID=UPI0025F9CC9C|nr:type II toxin-antitoxin system RelE/ParE family toxin [uncultured Campylobacter sp.]
MKIVFSDKFGNGLDGILNFIAQDSLNRATEFNDALYEKILEIPSRPYSFRKNKLLKREDTRDLIFKGYVIVFRIKPGHIKIMSIYKHNLPDYC